MTENSIKSQPRLKHKILKRTLKWFLLTLSFFIFLIGIAILLLWIYEDDIKQYALSQINKSLKTEIKVKHIETSFFNSFPYASIDFIDVSAEDATTFKKKGTLLKSKKISLEFNIWDILDGNYTFRHIVMNDGMLFLKVFKDGSNNWDIVKGDSVSNDSSGSFKLSKVHLNNVILKYYDYRNRTEISLLAKEMLFKGDFQADNYDMYFKAKLFVHFIRFRQITYLAGHNVNTKVNLSVIKNKELDISKGYISFLGLDFLLNGKFHLNNENDFNLTIDGKDLPINTLIDNLPEIYQNFFSEYHFNGNLNSFIRIQGNQQNILINADFKIVEGNIVHKKNNVKLDNLTISGHFTNGTSGSLSSSELHLQQLNFNLMDGNVQAKLSIVNFNYPEVSLQLNSRFNLENIQAFANFDTIKDIHGEARMNLSFNGKISDLSHPTPREFIESKTTGKLILSNVNWQLKNSGLKYSDFSSNLVFNNNDISIENLSGNIGSTDIKMNGVFINALSWIFLPTEKLVVDASLNTNHFNLDELLEKEEKKSSGYSFILPENINANIRFNAAEIKFRKYTSYHNHGNFILKNRKLLLEKLNLELAEGKLNADVIVDASNDNEIQTSCDARLSGMNIAKLFDHFENFGQDKMTSQHVKGKLTADVQYTNKWSKSFTTDNSTLKVKSAFVIENGELINYAPIEKLSKFIQVEELKHIKFHTLQNEMLIDNKTLSFPSMEIRSSAANFWIGGEHKFNNEINYHLKLNLSEYLSLKAKKSKIENEEFGIVEDDGLFKFTIYLLVTGTIDNPKFKYDRKAAKEKFKEDLKAEKQTLKQILNEEFGLFKKDSTLNKPSEKSGNEHPVLPPKKKKKDEEQHEEFKVEWE